MSNGNSDPKVIDLIKETKDDGQPYISLEYFPPRTEEGVKNLYSRMDRMKKTVKPVFSDITWGAGGSTADLSLDLALYLHKTGHVANMHLTCTNIVSADDADKKDPKQTIHDALQTALDGGVRNIVALRGDPPAGQAEWKAADGGFACALDLVVYIRENFGDKFGISVAGYPEGHPNAITAVEDPTILSPAEKLRCSSFDGGKTYYCCRDEDYRKEMDYLKKKVDAGADFVITQMFFDVKTFLTFVDDCRKWGIDCPIVPGIMCINNYSGFVKMTNFCKTRVPDDLMRSMEDIKDDPAKVKQFGVDYGVKLCRELLDSKKVTVLHFYTLNLEKVVYGVLDGLGLSTEAALTANEADASAQTTKAIA